MQAATAAQLLEHMTYKPGTTVRASALGDTKVYLYLTFDSWDSTPDRYGHHDRATFGSPPITLDVSGLNEAEVAGVGLLALHEVESHETREFWRVNHGPAPFHPHNRSGEEAWQAVQRLKNRVTVRYPEPAGA